MLHSKWTVLLCQLLASTSLTNASPVAEWVYFFKAFSKTHLTFLRAPSLITNAPIVERMIYTSLVINRPASTSAFNPPPPPYNTGTCCFHLTETEQPCVDDSQNLQIGRRQKTPHRRNASHERWRPRRTYRCWKLLCF